MNILQQEDVIKGLPDNVLMQQAQQPTGELPEFLVVSEIQRREKMRKSFAETVPEQSVKDQVLSSGIAAMNPNPDPLMATAMGAQDPMMGQMQDPMQQQMMQQQMMQDPMQQQMPMQDPMMQDPMMQQQMMAAGGGMMPYRMSNVGRVPDSFNAPYQSDAPSTHGPAKAQALRAIMQEEGVDESLALRIYDHRQSEAVREQMGAFMAGVDEPYVGGLESNNVVNDEMLLGQIDGSNVFGPNDGTSPLVQDRFPGTQSVLGPNLGNAVARQAIAGVDNAIDAGLQFANYSGSAMGDPYNLSAQRPTKGSEVDPELFNSDDVYSVLQDIKNAGIEAGEVIGRDAEYLSDRGPEFVEAGQAGLDYIANSRVGQALGSAKDFLTTPIFESYPEANIFAAENNTQLPGFLEMLQRNSSFGGGDSSLPEEIAGEPALGGLAALEKSATGYVDRFRNMLDGKPSWFGNASKEDFGKITPKDAVDPEVVKMVEAPNTGSEGNKNKPLGQDTEQELRVVDTQENARVDAYERIGTDAGDPEGLLKGLFGRSYKPMDDGALALINLGAGIAKGDVAGGMLGAVKSIGESRDRDRKDMLAKAQAEFYASGGRGAKDTAMDVEIKAGKIYEDLKVMGRANMYEQLMGEKPTAEIMRSPQYKKIIMDALRAKIVALERTPINSMSGGSGAVGNKIQEANSFKRMIEGLY